MFFLYFLFKSYTYLVLFYYFCGEDLFFGYELSDL